jgi:hypothetical protein
MHTLSGRARLLLIFGSLCCVCAVPVTFWLAAMSGFIADSPKNADAAAWLVPAALLWPVTCLAGAILPWVLRRRKPSVRFGMLALPVIYPLLWLSLAVALLPG